MVAVPAHINCDETGSFTPGRRHSDTEWDLSSYLPIAISGADASYDWLGESAAWATMTAAADGVVQSYPEITQLPRIEMIGLDSLHLSCATTPTPTPTAIGSAKSACSSIKAPWMRSLRCTPRNTPPSACAPRSPRKRTARCSSTELLTTSPSHLLPPRPRGLAQLAQRSRQSRKQSSGQPREPKTPPPPLPLPARNKSTPQSPKVLALELEQNVSVTNTKLENGVGLYEITWSDKSDTMHTVWRRYSDFSALHMSLCDDRMVGAIVGSIAFPPKRPLSSISRAQREKLLVERRDDLENYLARLVLEGIVVPDKNDASGERLAAFLSDS